MKKILMLLVFSTMPALAIANQYCYGRICLMEDYIVHSMDSQGYELIERLILENENSNMPYESILVSKAPVGGQVFILKMRRPHEYGSEFILQKIARKPEWKILYERSYVE